MKQKFIINHWWLLAVMIFSSLKLDALKIWNNNPTISEPSAFAPVVDENLEIIGNNGLIGHIHIEALTADVIVSLPSGDATVSANDGSGPSALHFFADAGRTIRVDLTNNLTFDSGIFDFLITFSGAGNLVFNLGDNKYVTFGTMGLPTGVIFAVNMDALTHSPLPESVLFTRISNSNADTFVDVGPGSRVVYVSTTAGIGTSTDTSTITFDPSNTGTGRLTLTLADNAGFLVSGRFIFTLDDPDITDIDFSLRSGDRANFDVVNGQIGAGAFSGLLIVNNNTILPAILANPWCEDSVCPPCVSRAPAPIGCCTAESFPGFILDENGTILVANDSYIDYVGTVTNRCPVPAIPASILDDRTVESVVKPRNPSALIVDGSQFDTVHAQILFQGESAFYFRSGVDHDGLVTTGVVTFTINPVEQNRGLDAAGNFVLDVEGTLDVIGLDMIGNKAINILSWQVAPTGGPILPGDTSTLFPLRTFAKDIFGRYLQYNAAAFLINSRVNLYNVNLLHNDEIHVVFEKNFPELHALVWGNFPEESAPTYVGGESWTLCCDRPRPKIAFYQANFLLQTSAALTGVDLAVPEFENDPSGLTAFLSPLNDSSFTFYYNGRCVDNGTGRSLVMGTIIGSLACDFNTIVNADSHLDVMQEHATTSSPIEILRFNTAANTAQFTPGISGDITNQFPVNTFFLGHASNLSIGTNGSLGTDITTGAPFTPTTLPTVSIESDFFSFETQGGTIRQPEASMVTGEGGIFVDQNGTLQILDHLRANMATVVTKSFNGIITLPRNSVFFNLRTGIAQWNINLSDPAQTVLVNFGESLSKYTFDWKYVKKDFCSTGTGLFIPYELPSTPLPCHAPAVSESNLTNLPTIHGSVDQLLIRNSRLGDQANILIDAGEVRELVFLERAQPSGALTGNASSDESGVAPVGFIVLQDDAILGLGSANRNLDSDQAQVVLGINGVTLVANGTAVVRLNEDALINNVAHILTGPAFGVGGQQALFITSAVPRELRIRNDSVLDLSQFTNANQVLSIAGNVRVVVEPGARIILGGGILRFGEQSQLVFEPFLEPNFTFLETVSDTDDIRAKISGAGQLIMAEDSIMQIFRGAYVGVESYLTCTGVTNMTWELQDNGRILIGDEANFGGSLQIGDTVTTSTASSINFRLIINGQGALLNLNSQGFLGLNAGIISKPNSAPDTWTENTLNNVQSITINILEGVIQHNQILPGSNPLADLLLIGDGPLYTFTYNDVDTEILGGGNIGRIASSPTALNVIVDSTDSNGPTLGTSILATRPMLSTDNVDKGPQPVNVTSQVLFSYLKTTPFTLQIPNKLASLFLSSLGVSTIGWVDGAIIRRNDIDGIYGSGGNYVSPTNSLEVGTVGIGLNADHDPIVFEINVGL